jgi:phosphate transport system permease protein
MLSRLTKIDGIQAKEMAFKSALFLGGIGVVSLMGAAIITLGIGAWPAITKIGTHFISDLEWNPTLNHYAALPLVYGTVLVAIGALVIALPVAVAVALLTTVIIKNRKIQKILNSGLDILSAVPSVVFGLWGLATIVPLIRQVQLYYDMPPYGVSVISALVTLAIMSIPFAAALIREVIKTIPNSLIDATYALGATPYEMTKTVILPYAKSGIIAGGILALGRALGETMAVSMLIGNVNQIPQNILEQGNTISSLLVTEFQDALDPLYHSSLITLALVLFGVTTVMSILGRRIIIWFQSKN